MDWQVANDALTKLATEALTIGLVILAGYVTSWVKAKADEIKKNLAPNEQALLDYITPIAVDAVEGQALTGLVGKGQAKQDAACKYITDFLASRNVTLDVGTIVARVEAEVVRAYNADKLAAAKAAKGVTNG